VWFRFVVALLLLPFCVLTFIKLYSFEYNINGSMYVLNKFGWSKQPHDIFHFPSRLQNFWAALFVSPDERRKKRPARKNMWLLRATSFL